MYVYIYIYRAGGSAPRHLAIRGRVNVVMEVCIHE